MEIQELKSLVNDNYISALVGFGASLFTLWLGQRLNNKDQAKNQYQNFFFKDEADHRRIMSWILKEVEDVTVDGFDQKNQNLRKSVIEYFLMLSSQYFRYKLGGHGTQEEQDYLIWEENIRKNLDYKFYREAWSYTKKQLHLKGDFSRVMDQLSQKEAKKDEVKSDLINSSNLCGEIVLDAPQVVVHDPTKVAPGEIKPETPCYWVEINEETYNPSGRVCWAYYPGDRPARGFWVRVKGTGDFTKENPR